MMYDSLFPFIIPPNHIIDSKCWIEKKIEWFYQPEVVFWFFKCAINSSCMSEHDRFSICNKSCKNKKHKPVYELGVCVKITVAIVCDPQNWHRCSYFHTSLADVPFFLSSQKGKKKRMRKIEFCLICASMIFFCFILFVSRVFSGNMYGLR